MPTVSCGTSAREHSIRLEDMAVLAHSIGAVVAATWVHDYAPPLRAMVLASPAFRVKLYVPFALAFLRLRLKFQNKAFVKSYVRPGMLTHDPAECESYARDPLIARSVAVNLLVEMHDAATRLLADAAAIRTPMLLLSSGTDYVVKLAPQREFFRKLGSPVKQMEEYAGYYHDLLHERDRERPIAQARAFLENAFARPAERRHQRAQSGEVRAAVASGRTSRARAAVGGATRFPEDRGHAQPRNPHRVALWFRFRRIARLRLPQPGGRHDTARAPDRSHLSEVPGLARNPQAQAAHPGRCSKTRSGSFVRRIARPHFRSGRGQRPLRARDGAAAGGHADHGHAARLVRDQRRGAPEVSRGNWDSRMSVSRRGDAFDRSSLASVEPRPTIAIVSGLYELFPDNGRVRESLLGIADALADDGYLIYTNQPWHPQLEMIARVLRQSRGQAVGDALPRAGGDGRAGPRGGLRKAGNAAGCGWDLHGLAGATNQRSRRTSHRVRGTLTAC